jgi:hypothetical protein
MSTGLGPTNVVTIFSTVFGYVTAIRAARKLPPLISVHLGREWIRAEESPPRIVVVPTICSYEFARQPGVQPPNGGVESLNPYTFAVRMLHFEAHLWGDEAPNPTTPLSEQDLWYSFDSTLELERELLDSLRFNLGNITNPRSGLNVRIESSRWEQPTNLSRLGRVLVLPFAFGTPVTSEPYTIVQPQTIAVDTKMVFDDGTSSDQGTFIIPP